MNKTLKEIADELQIDKQKVYRFVKKNHINEAHQSASVKQYDEAAQKVIKRHFLTDEPHQNRINEAHQNHINDAVFDALLKQLESKDKQIDELQRLLDQEQQLRMVSEQKMISENISENEQTKKQPKKHWWSR